MKLCIRFLLLLPLGFSPARAAHPIARPGVVKDAEIVTVSGEASVRFLSGADWQSAETAQNLTAGDVLRTNDYGRMGVLFVDGVQIKLSRKTTLAVKEVARRGTTGSTTLELQLGEIWSRAKIVPEGVRVQTPSATAAIRGTDWDIVVDEKGTSYLTVLRGSVDFSNSFGSLQVDTGQQAMAEIGRPPVRTFLVQPKERVQWVFSYALEVGALVPFRSHVRSRTEAALPAARQRVAGNPTDLDAKLELAGLLYDAQQNDESRRIFDEILAADPQNATALTYRGLIFLRLRDVDAADAAAKAAQATGRGKVEAELLRIGVDTLQGRVPNAAAAMDALAAQPDAPAVVGVVAVSFRAFIGDFTGAATIASTFAARFPNDERFLTLLSGIHLVLDDAPQARIDVEHALALTPESSAAQTMLGQIHYLEGHGEESRRAYQKAIELDPANAGAHNGLALVRADQGFYREAIAGLARALKSSPDSSLLWANRGFVSTLVEKLDAARGDYRKALDLDGGQYLALNGGSLVALKEGRTAEAIEGALKAGLLEPRLAQPHGLLAIAYYQQGKTARALQELDLAAQLDPNDPLPHLITYLIHQDNYRPYAAIQEAKKVLELLPYLKSVDALETTRQGISSLGSALLGFGLPEWAESYAQESFNPHDASSHFHASRRYNTNHIASVSEFVQGLLFDPLANSQPTRYQDIIRRPRMNLSVSGTWGDDADGRTQNYSATWQGYFRAPWETAYSVAIQGSDRAGDGVNNDSRGGSVVVGLGVRPNFENSFSLGLNLSRNRSGVPGSVADPDPDDSLKNTNASVDLGYRHRFGPKNNLLVRGAVERFTTDFRNPAPFGTGLTNYQAAFLLSEYFDFATTRRYFREGVYDTTRGKDYIELATDSTGTVARLPGVVRLPALPDYIDFDPQSRERESQLTRLLQFRHLLEVGDGHELTYGADYEPLRIGLLQRYNVFTRGATIYFFEEPILNPDYPYDFPSRSPAVVVEDENRNARFTTAYVSDRWKINPRVLLEGGLFFESLHDDFNRDDRLYPRLGLAAEIARGQVLRVGAQRLRDKVSNGTLAPVATAGLVVDNTLALQGSTLRDYQLRWESRWTDRVFTAVGIERTDLTDPDAGPFFTRRELRIERGAVAVNAILAEQLSGAVHYNHTTAKGSGGAFAGLNAPRVPRDSGDVSLTWVSPHFFQVSLAQSYSGFQFADFANKNRVPAFRTTNLSARWEPFDKRLLLSLSVGNVFNTGATRRSAFLTVEGRF